MKLTNKVISGIYLLVLSHFSLAGGSGWTDTANITELIPTAKHYYELKMVVKDNPSGCRVKDWFYQDYSTMGSDKMYNTLLEGLTARARFRVYVTGKCNLNGYSEISSVSITP